jgi:CrcB protein
MSGYLLIACGGALGAMGRFGVSTILGRLLPSGFPYAILLVNIVGSVAMGLLVGSLVRWSPSWAEEARLFAAVGVLGGFTTFSSFSLDTLTLIERGALLQAALYVLASVAVSVAGLYLGLLVTRGSLT